MSKNLYAGILIGGLMSAVAILLYDKYKSDEIAEEPKEELHETERQKQDREAFEKHLEAINNYDASMAYGDLR